MHGESARAHRPAFANDRKREEAALDGTPVGHVAKERAACDGSVVRHAAVERAARQDGVVVVGVGNPLAFMTAPSNVPPPMAP